MSKKKKYTYSVKTKTQEEEKAAIKEIASTVFNDFFKGRLKANYQAENRYLTLIPFVKANDEDGEIVAYTVTPRSNRSVEMYVDNEDIHFSLNGIPVKMDEDELLVAATNVTSFVERHLVSQS